MLANSSTNEEAAILVPTIDNFTLCRTKGKLGTNAMKRVAAAAHLPTPRLFEPAGRPDDRPDYCLVCSFLVQTPGTRFLQFHRARSSDNCKHCIEL